MFLDFNYYLFCIFFNQKCKNIKTEKIVCNFSNISVEIFSKVLLALSTALFAFSMTLFENWENPVNLFFFSISKT
jgi:hypothetical protein